MEISTLPPFGGGGATWGKVSRRIRGAFEKNEDKKCQNVKKEKREEIKKKKTNTSVTFVGGNILFSKGLHICLGLS
jgi:hypothetical protein